MMPPSRRTEDETAVAVETDPEVRRRMYWVWGVCIAGTVLISGTLSLQIQSVILIDKPMEIDFPYRMLVLAGAAVAGGLWGLIPKSCVPRYGARTWALVFLGLLGGVVLGQALLKWLLTANLNDLFFPVTKATWHALVDDGSGIDVGMFIFFLFLVPFTFFIDLFLAIPTMVALPFLPLVLMTAGPALGALGGTMLGRLGLRVFGSSEPGLRRARPGR